MIMDVTDADLALALQLQHQFESDYQADADILICESESTNTHINSVGGFENVHDSSATKARSLVDPHWELTDPNPDIRALFLEFNDQYFWGRLAGIEVKWSPRMTLCAGLCVYEGHGGLCSVRLSKPLLQLRPRKDLIETLLHEMIHAYLFVTDNNKDHDGHGPEFQKHMHRLNKETGTNITIYHTFHDEVENYRQHWWRCDGSCRSKPPYFGYVKRSMNRAPSPRDPWWGNHQQQCGGTYTKVKEPEGYGKKKGNKKESKEKGATKNPTMEKFVTGGVLFQKSNNRKTKEEKSAAVPLVTSKSKDNRKDMKVQQTTTRVGTIDDLLSGSSSVDRLPSMLSDTVQSSVSMDISTQSSSTKSGTIDSLLESLSSKRAPIIDDSMSVASGVTRPSESVFNNPKTYFPKERLKDDNSLLEAENESKSSSSKKSLTDASYWSLTSETKPNLEGSGDDYSSFSRSTESAISGKPLPTGRTTIHTISSSQKSQTEQGQSSHMPGNSDGGPRISTISSKFADREGDLKSTITFSGSGQALGQSGTGSTFLANLRKEMSQKSASSQHLSNIRSKSSSHKRLSSEIDSSGNEMSSNLSASSASPDKKKAKINTIETFFKKTGDKDEKTSHKGEQSKKSETWEEKQIESSSSQNCPVCQKLVEVSTINEHLDLCLQSGN